MSATSFFGGAFFGGEYFKASAPTNVVIDTHDGFVEDDEEARKKERLRYMLQHAIDPQEFPWPIPVPVEAVELADPFVEEVAGRVEIDWERLERETMIRAKLYAAAAEFERQRIAMEEDEEDVLTLLLH